MLCCAMPDLHLEHSHPAPVCGIDEAGRGPWAGPVVAAAVILPPGLDLATDLPGLDDSKALTVRRRAVLYEIITKRAEWAIGCASVAEIDRVNILNATWLAMRRALEALPRPPAFALIDGNRLPPGLPCPAQALVRGDSRSASIAAASVLAKVTRDRLMAELARDFPQYGWEKNAGYGVPAHVAALHRYGVTPHHRRSFAPIHKMLCEGHIVTP